jgi:hypothetical protein
MKKFIKWTLVFAIGLFIMACNTTQKGVTSTSDQSNTEEYKKKNSDDLKKPNSLRDFLVNKPGVMLQGSGFNTKVQIRGGDPLFVLNGVPIGRNYSDADNAVDVMNIKSVEVITNPTQAMRYTNDTAYGVILIKTNKT